MSLLSDTSRLLLVLMVVCLLALAILLRRQASVYQPTEADLRAGNPIELPKQPEPTLKLSPAALRTEIIALIESQLQAFRSNDFSKAYSFAAAGIQAQYPLRAFEQMVRVGYPAIAHADSATFGVVLDNGLDAVAEVKIHSATLLEPVPFRYLLRREPAGWKINGVLRLEKPASREEAATPLRKIVAPTQNNHPASISLANRRTDPILEYCET